MRILDSVVPAFCRGCITAAVLFLMPGYYTSQAQVAHPLDSVYLLKSTAPDLAFKIARRAWTQATEDSLRGKALLIMGALDADLGRYDSALRWLDMALPLFVELNDSAAISDVYEYRGVAWELLSKHDTALKDYETAYRIRKDLNLLRKQAYSLNSIGNMQVHLHQYPKALEHFLEVLRLGEEVGDDRLVTNAHNNIGMVYDYTEDLDKALDYYQRARQGFEKLNDPGGVGGALNNIGLVYKNKGEPEKAVPVYHEALDIFTSLKNPYGVGVLQNNLGVVYQLLGRTDESLAFHLAALKTNTQIGNLDGIANSNHSIGQCYLAMNLHRDAIAHFAKGLEIAEKIPSKQRMAEAYEGLSAGWEQLQGYKKSLEFLKEARVLRDSILSAEKFQMLYDLEQKYESAVKERQIAVLNAETANQRLAIAQQQQLIAKRNTQLVVVASFIVLIILVVYLFYSRLRLIQKAKLQVLANEKEQAVIKSIYEQRLNISKDMHDEIGSGLTHIAMLSEVVALRSPVAGEARSEIQTITDIARSLIESMSEIIWALNPQNESLSNLVAYLREQTNKYFDPFDVKYTMDVPEGMVDVRLGNVQRRNLFLVTKETLNNALKHAGASKVRLSIRVIGGELQFQVQDDGRGFDMEKIRRSANGLKNMRGRMEEIGGSFTVSSDNTGTTVRYSLPLDNDLFITA